MFQYFKILSIYIDMYLWKIEVIVYSWIRLLFFLVRLIYLIYLKCCVIWFLKYLFFGILEIISVRDICLFFLNFRFTRKCRIRLISKIRKVTVSIAWIYSKGELLKYREEMFVFKYLQVIYVFYKLVRFIYKISLMLGIIAKIKGVWIIIRKYLQNDILQVYVLL